MIASHELHDEIYATMQLKSTQELQRIWDEHNSDEWTPLAFTVVAQLLKERTGKERAEPGESNRFHTYNASHRRQWKLPENKTLRSAEILYLTFFGLLVLSNILFPGKGGMTDPPSIGLVLLLGMSVCILVLSIVSIYVSWTYDATSFRRWIDSQSIYNVPSWAMRSRQKVSADMMLWMHRLLSPMMFLFGVVFLVFALSSIISLLVH